MNGKTTFGLATFVLAGVVIAPAGAETITVTTSADDIDVDWQTATVADLPGPDGKVSFSEAMIAANNTPGHDRVEFAIPQDDWILQFIYPGRAVLTALTGFFFNSSDDITIDGTTQTAFTGDTNPDGWEVAIYGDDLSLGGPSSTLIGFDSTSVFTGSNSTIEGNTGAMNITVSGSGSRIAGNTGGTIKLSGASDTVVVGNTVQRVRVIGGSNNRIGGPNPEDRNFLTGYGTWNSEGLPGGTTVQLAGAVGTRVENNQIGTTPEGLDQGSLASNIGIGFEGENHDTVITNNRIAGILGHGQGPHHAGQLFGWAILVGGSGSGITVVGNTIGLDANDEPLLGSVWGIDVGDARNSTVTDIRIGGTAPGEGNIVAGHILNGITIGNDVPQVRLSGNPVYSNGWLGIDLIPSNYGYGVTPNDPLDADDGGNGLQNFPEITSASREGGGLRVVGALHSTLLDDFTIEVFASPACDDSGFGEGMAFLGATIVVTDAAGDAAVDFTLPLTVPDGWLVTTTATLEPLGATSEFSACVDVTGDLVLGDMNGDGVVDTVDLLAMLAAWGPCGGCPEDVNGDGFVDVVDLLIMLANWG